MSQIYQAIGLMSGTSLDGIDVALIETDGLAYVNSLAFLTLPYEKSFQDRVRSCFGNPRGRMDPQIALVERDLTLLHVKAVKTLLKRENLRPEEIDLIGFHGQTTWHHPAERETVQLGDGLLLARETEIDVVDDFRTADVRAGGQGAPLLPLYHRALAAKRPKPLAIVNIGGVANLTWIGGEKDDELLAFDTGPGNALLNDWVLRRMGEPFDRDGRLAAAGKIDEEKVRQFLDHSYFRRKGPKSLDRDTFLPFMPFDLSIEDGAATLTMMTVQSIALGLRQAGQRAANLYLCGGGAHNPVMRQWLGQATGGPVGTVEDLGWNSDALEAEGFAYLAVRSVLDLPISLPGTTGVPWPMHGGRLNRH